MFRAMQFISLSLHLPVFNNKTHDKLSHCMRIRLFEFWLPQLCKHTNMASSSYTQICWSFHSGGITSWKYCIPEDDWWTPPMPTSVESEAIISSGEHQSSSGIAVLPLKRSINFRNHTKSFLASLFKFIWWLLRFTLRSSRSLAINSLAEWIQSAMYDSLPITDSNFCLVIVFLDNSCCIMLRISSNLHWGIDTDMVSESKVLPRKTIEVEGELHLSLATKKPRSCTKSTNAS